MPVPIATQLHDQLRPCSIGPFSDSAIHSRLVNTNIAPEYLPMHAAVAQLCGRHPKPKRTRMYLTGVIVSNVYT